MTIDQILQLKEADLLKMPLEELALMNRQISQILNSFREVRSVLLMVITRKQEDQAAAKVITKLTPERRSALKRLLEQHERTEVVQSEADKASIASLASAVNEVEAERLAALRVEENKKRAEEAKKAEQTK